MATGVVPVATDRVRLGRRALASGSVVADSKQTLLCTYLSAVLLAGLLVNAWLGWWWADPVAGLVIAGVAVQEGVRAWRGEGCGCGPSADPRADTDTCCAACEPAATDRRQP